ncbi:hypothetical protein TanjilG_16087 [Lupinus angustifolius]|uniref:Growth-regulating factor n=1 Tax=Lupinus angustifolius TaxID=3871 RepID=A0A4P1RHE5_LUPAN|nr:hypothetical protein TanjilG_16087 [Lupinus angustifolius]
MSVPNTPPAMMFMASQPLFTVAQWQELEHQALIFKYFKAGLTVPPDLLVPIQKSLQLIMSQQNHPSLGYYGKKIDPEPGRCKRTDGKKWRCSKDAHPVVTTGITTTTVCAPTRTFQNLPLHTNVTRQGFTIGNENNSTMNMGEPLPLPNEVSRKELRYMNIYDLYYLRLMSVSS